jgi:hypothetical protein
MRKNQTVDAKGYIHPLPMYSYLIGRPVVDVHRFRCVSRSRGMVAKVLEGCNPLIGVRYDDDLNYISWKPVQDLGIPEGHSYRRIYGPRIKEKRRRSFY